MLYKDDVKSELNTIQLKEFKPESDEEDGEQTSEEKAPMQN